MLFRVSRVWTNSTDDLREGFWLRKEKESMAKKDSAEQAVRDIRRKTRRRFSAEEKIRIVPNCDRD